LLKLEVDCRDQAMLAPSSATLRCGRKGIAFVVQPEAVKSPI
jgi:hypothetical protein